MVGNDDARGLNTFATTQWSVVIAAQGASPAADEALEKLCRSYWRPIYSFVRREGRSVEDAQDLTQGFFGQLLQRRDFSAVRREKGRLRSYLLVSLKHFLADDWERSVAIKRGGGRPLVSLDELILHERNDPEPADALSADKIFERRWALTVLERALDQLGERYDAVGNAALFQHFRRFLADEPGGRSQAQIAAEMKMTENAVKQAYHRFRSSYRELLREEIGHTVLAPGDIEDELRHLVSILRA